MRIILIFAVLLLTACASKQSPYGNFTNQNLAQKGVDNQLANDVIKQIQREYPAAGTKFNLIHTIEEKDEFGKTLINDLRQKGFAIAEYNKSVEPDGHSFAYIIDYINGNNLVVTIKIDTSSISRMYEVDQHQAKAIGYWSHME